jgi:hypothetical protein
MPLLVAHQYRCARAGACRATALFGRTIRAVEDRFVILNAFDPRDLEWTLSVLHLARMAGIKRVVQLRGFSHERSDVLDVARECRALDVTLELLDEKLALDAGFDGKTGEEIASGVRAWRAGARVTWGGRSVALLGYPGELTYADVERLPDSFVGGADIAIGGELSVSWNSNENAPIGSPSVRDALNQLRPLLHVCPSIAGRVDLTEVVEGTGIAVCGIPCASYESVVVLDMVKAKVLGTPRPMGAFYRGIS